jgi:hypothetical protein
MSPAFQLLAACCRWPADDRRAQAIASIAREIDDWPEVVRLADRHRVEPLVAHGLAAAGLAVPPELAAAVTLHRALGLRDMGEALRLAAAFDEAGIAYRFLKGAPLGVTAYGTPLLKRSWDIDMLVLPDQVVAAAAVLASQHYVPRMPPRPLGEEEFKRWSAVSKEAELRAPGGSVLELHWGVSDHPMLLRGLGARSPVRQVALLGTHEVATLADDANLAYLAVHGTAHGWARLKWLADFNALLAQAERPDQLVERARAFGVGRAIDTALALSRYLFHDVAPACLPPLARLSLAALASDDWPAIYRLGARIRWRMAPGVRFRFREATIRLRGTLDRVDYPLDPKWQFLYPLLRAPFWALRKARR